MAPWVPSWSLWVEASIRISNIEVVRVGGTARAECNCRNREESEVKTIFGTLMSAMLGDSQSLERPNGSMLIGFRAVNQDLGHGPLQTIGILRVLQNTKYRPQGRRSDVTFAAANLI